MRALIPAFLALTLLPGCPEPTPPGECSETAKITGYRDEDGDGHGDPATKALVCEVGVGGWVPTGLDCDDTRSAVSPDKATAVPNRSNASPSAAVNLARCLQVVPVRVNR